MQNNLNLPSINILNVQETDTQYTFEVEALYRPNLCQRCGYMTKMVAYGNFKRSIIDLPMHGKQTLLYLISKRYKCYGCEKTFLEQLPDIDEKRSMTKRLVKYIAKNGLEKPFTTLVQEIGNITLNTVKAVCVDYLDNMEQKNLPIVTPEIIGIDEIHLLSGNRAVITNITQKTLIDMLEDRKLETIVSFLNKLPDKQNVKYITIDMWRPYKTAVNKVLPHAKIIIDKFHVIKYANQVMDNLRKELSRSELLKKNKKIIGYSIHLIRKRFKTLSAKDIDKIESIFKQYPAIQQAYQLKEQFCDIYEADSKEHAYKLYNEWVKAVENSEIILFTELTQTVNNWHSEIFNYFDNKVTNAFTESLNGIIRFAHRQGRGYSFKILRGKILFMYGKRTEIEINQKFISSDSPEIMYDDLPKYTQTLKTKISYGIDLSTLAEILDNVSI